ncbi:MAG TPA: hypothetical protein VNB06_19905, partial [Thermoanaerobaculia bacterium]|nr:hypothetical protein [Thermoanaerobaculia bacterium]
PERAAAVLSTLDVPVVVEVLERRDGWVRVRHGAVSGWVAPPGLGGGLRAERVAAVDPQRREQRVAAARAVLGRGGDQAIELAGVSWVTDVPSRSATFQRLLAIASCLPEVYGERYGLPEVAAEELPRQVVVLFARERDYRSYVEQMGELESAESGGHYADGIAVLFTGDRDEEDVAATLAHELVHLHNARASTYVLPGWLEEGLAQDLGLAAAGSEGCPVPGAWPHLRVTEEERVVAGEVHVVTRWRAGGEARAAACAALDWRSGADSPRLAELVELPIEELSAPAGRARRYLAAAALVRVLLDGGSARRAAFLELLAALRAGEARDLHAVLASVGTHLAAAERELVELLLERLDLRLCDPRVAE